MAPGTVIGIKHRWEPQPFYDIWSKMGLAWFARQANEDEWHVFVHHPAHVPSQPIKARIGSEIGAIPLAEAGPRVVTLAEQVAPNQVLEVTGATEAAAQAIRDALQARHGDRFLLEDETADNALLRIRPV
jgi:hypothetical protein